MNNVPQNPQTPGPQNTSKLAYLADKSRLGSVVGAIRNNAFWSAVYIVSALVLMQGACNRMQDKTTCGLDNDHGQQIVIDAIDAYKKADIKLKLEIVDEVDKRTNSLLHRDIKEKNCPDSVRERLNAQRQSQVSLERASVAGR